MQPEAGDEDDNRRRARRETSAQAKHRDLRRRDAPAGKFLGDFAHVMARVRVVFIVKNRRQCLGGGLLVSVIVMMMLMPVIAVVMMLMIVAVRDARG